MNREIKFRIWDKTWKRFYYGTLTKHGFESTLNPNGPVGELDVWEQYSGLKDKYGTEIYEGDVMTVPYKRDEDFVVSLKNGRFNNSNHSSSLCEIIGNIHKDPDLKKV